MTVSAASQTFMGVSAFFCIGAPFIYWLVIREKVKLRQAIFGVVCYFLFVLILEGQLHNILLAEGSALMNNKILYVLYIGFMAAIIEEGTRYFFFRYYLKNKFDRADAGIGFGIGFALPELLVAGVTSLNNFSLALMLNQNGVDYILAESATEAIAAQTAYLQQLCSMPAYYYFLTGMDRMFFLAQQVAMSVIVWYAATRDDSNHLFIVAILAHAVTSMPAALYQFDPSVNMLIVELVYFVLVGATVFFALRLYKKNEALDMRGFNPDRLKARTRR